MSVILSLETATEVCSVALSMDGNILALKEASGSNEHSSSLTVFVGDVMKEAGLSLRELDAVAVSMGPGSYTGLRIGVSAAKGLCYSLDKPLIAVSTLKAMAKTAQGLILANQVRADLLCPMIDARRMEVFTGIYDLELGEVTPIDALVLDEMTFNDFDGKKIAVFGNGAEKCQFLYKDKPNILFPFSLHATAESVARLAHEKFLISEFENVAYFEPFYLKDFIAGKPKVKGLHS